MTQSKTPRQIRGYKTWLEVGQMHSKCQRALNTLLRTLDLTLAQHEVLVRVSRTSGITQNELSQKLLVVKSNVSSLLKKLESRGLVSRTVDLNDSRNKHLTLTRSGNALLKKSMQLQERVIEAMMAPLSDADIEHTYNVMQRVSAGLDNLQVD